MNGGTARLLAALALTSGLVLLAADLAAPILGRSHPVAVLGHAALAATCQQRAERSFTLGGQALSGCARCVGLHASGVTGGLLVLLLPAGAAAAPRSRRLSSIALLGLVPLLADVAAGLVLTGWDHPWLRAATGLVAGTALLASLAAGGR